MEDDERLLCEAEEQKILRERTPKSLELYDKKLVERRLFLDPKIIVFERQKTFTLEKQNRFYAGSLGKIVTSAERSRLVYIILDKRKI